MHPGAALISLIPALEEGMHLRVCLLHSCITDASGELPSQGCGGWHTHQLLSGAYGGETAECSDTLVFHTASRALPTASGRSDLCRRMSEVK